MSVAENAGAQMLAGGSWQVDPVHSVVEFRVRHMMIATVKGRFRDFDGAIVSGEVPSVAGSIRVASLETLDLETVSGQSRTDPKSICHRAFRWPQIHQSQGSAPPGWR